MTSFITKAVAAVDPNVATIHLVDPAAQRKPIRLFNDGIAEARASLLLRPPQGLLGRSQCRPELLLTALLPVVANRGSPLSVLIVCPSTPT